MYKMQLELIMKTLEKMICGLFFGGIAGFQGTLMFWIFAFLIASPFLLILISVWWLCGFNSDYVNSIEFVNLFQKIAAYISLIIFVTAFINSVYVIFSEKDNCFNAMCLTRDKQ